MHKQHRRQVASINARCSASMSMLTISTKMLSKVHPWWSWAHTLHTLYQTKALLKNSPKYFYEVLAGQNCLHQKKASRQKGGGYDSRAANNLPPGFPRPTAGKHCIPASSFVFLDAAVDNSHHTTKRRSAVVREKIQIDNSKQMVSRWECTVQISSCTFFCFSIFFGNTLRAYWNSALLCIKGKKNLMYKNLA